MKKSRRSTCSSCGVVVEEEEEEEEALTSTNARQENTHNVISRLSLKAFISRPTIDSLKPDVTAITLPHQKNQQQGPGVIKKTGMGGKRE